MLKNTYGQIEKNFMESCLCYLLLLHLYWLKEQYPKVFSDNQLTPYKKILSWGNQWNLTLLWTVTELQWKWPHLPNNPLGKIWVWDEEGLQRDTAAAVAFSCHSVELWQGGISNCAW